jgi:hypothetical protein
MRKLASIVLALGLTTKALFGNPLSLQEESQEKPFSLETTLTAENPGENFNTGFDIRGEYNFKEEYKILGELEVENNLPKKAIFATGNKNMYLGAKWENLSNETSLLEDANLFKLETGMRDVAGFLNLSSFAAYTQIPNMKTRWIYETPLKIYTFGIDGIVKPKFELENLTIMPWLSGKILINGPIAQNTEYLGTVYDDSSLTWAFNHLNVGLGADFLTKNFDFGLENYLDGNYYPFMPGTIHKARAKLHDKENKNSLEYVFLMNPQFSWLGWPANWDLQSEIDLKLSLPSGIYIRGIGNINHSNFENSNLTAVLGYLDKSGSNLEFFYNLQNKLIGITFSSKGLGNCKNRYSKEPFEELVHSRSDIYTFSHDSTRIHDDWGENVSDVINKIKSKTGNYNSAMQEISRYVSYFDYIDHEGTYTAEQEHDLGSGVCRDTNGVLLPTVINGVLGSRGYKSWGEVLFGSYIGHAITIIQKPNNRYDIMDYNRVYYLDAKTEQEAIDRVYPGAYAYDGGKYSTSSERVINALEESVWR